MDEEKKAEDAPDNADGGRPLPRSGLASLQSTSAWIALGLMIAGAIGFWHLYLELERRVGVLAEQALKFPRGAVVAYALGPGVCPDKWNEVTELRGRVILGAGQGNELTNRVYGSPGGREEVALATENLPPHQHEVYPHAGQIIGPQSPTPGAGSEDPNKGSNVRAGLTGSGVGLVAKPFDIMPPYIPYTFCSPAD